MIPCLNSIILIWIGNVGHCRFSQNPMGHVRKNEEGGYAFIITGRYTLISCTCTLLKSVIILFRVQITIILPFFIL